MPAAFQQLNLEFSLEDLQVNLIKNIKKKFARVLMNGI